MFGRPRPPAAVVALLERDERVLAWGNAASGEPLVATNLGLWWPASPSLPARRIPWYLVAKVVWAEEGFFVTEAELVDDLLLVDLPPARIELEEPRKLPAVVKRRVEANIARTHEVRLSDGSARVVGRKVPGQDGLSWWARLTPGTPDTAAVRAELLAVIEPLRAESAARLDDLKLY